MREELPRGWVACTVRDVIESAQAGFASGEKNVDRGIAHLRMNNIGVNGELVLDLIRHVPASLRKEQYELRSGDVLVCTTNSGKLVGKSTYFDRDGLYCFSNHITRLRPNRSIVNGQLLQLSLWLSWKLGTFDEKCKNWVNQSTLPKEDLLDTTILLAPLNEQSRMVTQLNTAIGKVTDCQARLARIPAFIRRFRQSVLEAACSGRLTADWRDEHSDVIAHHSRAAFSQADFNIEEITDTQDGWVWAALNSVCDPNRSICYGVIKLGFEHKHGIPCLRTSDVRPLRIDTANVKHIDPQISGQFGRTVLRGGEVLVNVRGTLGGVAVVPVELQGWNISREVAVVPVSTANPEYIAYWIASLPAQKWLTAVVKGVAYSGINIEDLRQLPVALPSMAEQEEIVLRVKGLLALAEKIETRYKAVQQQVDRLPQCILAKAFDGELVPTEAQLAEREGRTYESAEQLLSRIRSEKTSKASNNGNPRKKLIRHAR